MLIVLVGGALLLVYGVRLAGQGLKNAAGAQIKNSLSQLTSNRFLGFFVGIMVTFLLQSSSSAAVLLQTLAVLLGAGIGASLTVQLISFQLHNIAIGVVGLGLVIYFLSSSPQRKALGEGIFGFGLVFLSIKIVTETMEPLKHNDLFLQILVMLGQSPVLLILLTAALTALMQSSAATMGLGISLAMNNFIDLKEALPIMLGANLGTISTPLIVSNDTHRG